MESINFYERLPESLKNKLREQINITDNDEFVSWMTLVPDDVLLDIGINNELIREIKKSEFYLTCSNNNESNRFGYIPESDDTLTFKKKDDSYAASSEIVNTIPSSVNLCNHYNRVRNQENKGTCVGFGVAAAMESALDYKFELSPQFAYQIAKMIDGNQREGTTIKSCINGISKYGICKEHLYPYNPNQIFIDPPTNVFKEAKNIQLVRYKENHGLGINEWMISCLAGKLFHKPLAIAIGVVVFQSSWNTESTRRTGKLLEPYHNEKPSSGHSVAIVGYVLDTGFPGGGYFIFRNQWGEIWAREGNYSPAGYGIMSFSYAAKNIKEAVVAVEMSINKNDSQVSISNIVNKTPFDNSNYVFTKNNNPRSEIIHEVIIGKTGSGKTYRITHNIQHTPDKKFFIIDVHGDFSSNKEFVESTNSKVWDVIKYGLPYNVLGSSEKSDGRLSEENSLGLQVEWLLGCFKACKPEIGSRQMSLLREEIEQQVFAYHSFEGLDVQLSDMLTSLKKKQNQKGAKGNIARSLTDQLTPIFTLGILDCKHNFSLQDLIKKNKNIIFKCEIPDQVEHILKLISIFLVSGIFSTYKMSEIGKTNPGIIVQDEYHLMPKHAVWEKITREGRKFNLGLWVSSQEINDMKDLLPNIGKRHIFKVANGNQAREIAKNLGWTNKQKKEIVKILAGLADYEFFDPNDVEI